MILTVLCNGMQFDVCINRADLGGEPEAGRRFKGGVNFTVCAARGKYDPG